jgi:hypothetical protein
MQLMDHNEVRKKADPETWNGFQKDVVDVIRKDLGLGDRFSENQVQCKCKRMDQMADYSDPICPFLSSNDK